jgi:hypothetical protein
MSRNIILIAVIVVIAAYLYMRSADKQQQMTTSETSQQQAQVNKDNNDGATEDEILVDNLIKEGIIARIEEEGNSPKVYITARYITAPDTDKEDILKVLYKNFRATNPEVNSYTIYDAKSGNLVGTYDDSGFTDK